jgi:hypothetical protein
MQDQHTRPEEFFKNLELSAPNTPAIQLAKLLADELLKSLTATPSGGEEGEKQEWATHQVGGILHGFFLRSIRAARRKEAHEKHEQYQFPEFEHLPIGILGLRNKKLRLLDASYEQTRAWVKHLRAPRKSPVTQEAEALCERMRIASKKRPGITVREMLGL